MCIQSAEMIEPHLGECPGNLQHVRSPVGELESFQLASIVHIEGECLAGSDEPIPSHGCGMLTLTVIA